MPRYALIVGISKYKSRRLRNLSKPAQDAKAVAAVLKQYGQFDTAPKVLHESVTYSELVEALRTFLEKQAVNGDAFIYFTGHGISVPDPFGGESQGYLAASDSEVKVSAGQVSPPENAIPFTSLNNLIQKANLSSLVMLIDTCHSGDFVGKAAYSQSFSAINNKSNCLLIAACRDFEEALAKKSADHSLFTDAVLKALVAENADRRTGAITSGRLADELISTLKGSPQEPEAYGKGLGLKIIEFPPEERMSTATPNPEQDSAVLTTKLTTVPRQMPPLPDHFVERPEKQQQVKADLLCKGTKVGTLVVSAIYGLGGIGKSVLAAKLARDPDIQSHFADGILWVTLGQGPDILPLLSGWIQALGDNDYKPTAIESASNHLRTLLYDKCVLLVVDDVWNPAHLEPFRVGGEGSCVLVTTREARISGAHLHQLDVMSPEQSLELMTQKLSEPLSDSAHQQALSFAERVGHLPLALELAVSQIEDGVTWRELVEDFQSEIVRLETLDVYGQTEMPDEEKRRKYSLLACFNLSLKQLSLEQLRQFAWLGVVPEDVSLTQEMAETLWQVTSRQAGLILRIFRSKSLVLKGAQQADERPSYRMHDLMHDLAQQLLTSPPQPLREEELPGLGLTKAEAHSQLLERYRKKTQKGQWHTIKDDGYIYAYLTWHMEQAKQPESIHQLLQVSNEEGRNGWYEACDAIGKPVGFVNDIGRGWTQAVKSYEQSPNQSILLLFRYALVKTSLNSLACNVSAGLVKALVEKGVWKTAQGLAYVQQVQDPWQRAECITAILPYISEALLPEILETSNRIEEAAYRSYVLSKIARRFPKVWLEVLSTIQQIHDRYGRHRQSTRGFFCRAFALKCVVSYLPPQYVNHALIIAGQIQEASDRTHALIALAEHSPELWSEALSVAKEIEDKSSRARALIALAEHLPELRSEAQSETREVKEFSRSSVLRDLAKHLPVEILPEALSVAKEIEDKSYRAKALSELAKYLPIELLPEALDATREINDKYSYFQTMSELAQAIPKLWPEMLSVSKEIKNEIYRSTALVEIVKHLPVNMLPKAIRITRGIKYAFYRAVALGELAKHRPELWSEALSMMLLEDEHHQSLVLTKFAKHLPVSLWPEALNIAQAMDHNRSRSHALIALAEHQPELWSEAMSATREIKDESSRCYALGDLAKDIPVELLPEVLDAVQETSSWHSRSHALTALAEYLPVELLPNVLDAVRETESEFYQTLGLSELVKYMPELFPEALSKAIEIKDKYSKYCSLSTLAEHQPELWPEVLSVMREIKSESSRSWAAGFVGEHLPKEMWPEVLNMMREIKDESRRSYALKKLVKHLPKEMWPEVLNMMREIKDESCRSIVFGGLATDFPTELLPLALETIRSLKDSYFRLDALKILLPQLEKLPISFPEWMNILDDLACQNRSSLVEILPLVKLTLIRLSGREDTFLEILYSVRDVVQQWP